MSRQKETHVKDVPRHAISGFQLRQSVDHSVAVLLACVLTLLSGLAMVAATIQL